MKAKTLVVLIFLIGLLPTAFIFAQSSSLDAIQILQEQITKLQKQIADLQVQLGIVKKTEVPIAKNIIFTKTLQRGMKDDEVKQLQEFLKRYPDIYPEGLVTSYFGPFTEAAVKRFQGKHAEDILAPLGLTQGTGYVGEVTRAKLNKLAAASGGAAAVPAQPAQPAVPAEPATPATPAVPAIPTQPATTTVATTTPAVPTEPATPAVPATPATPAVPPSTEPEPTPPQRIYPEEDIKQYATWEKINVVLSDLGISAIFTDDNWKSIEPSLSEKEKMRESLMYFTYILDSRFKGTRIGETLQKIKIAPANSVWSHIFLTVQISLRPENMNPDDYINSFIHEVGHGFHTYLANLDVKNNTDLYSGWNRICWPIVDGQMQRICVNEKEKSFVSQGLTTRKYEAQTAPQIYGYYYSGWGYGEDFAESFTAYVVSPNEFRGLAQKYPKLFEKYEFLKTKVFLEQEY